ncbi:peptidase M24, structural domain-containing protein [Dissophora ornata]|nr:peptidase M24, structural domain-containing protein [Dissophora ornata]
MLARTGLKYPSKLHCKKVASNLSKHARHNAIILVKGNAAQLRDNTDTDLPFRQESNFFYLSGVQDPDCYFIYDFSHSKSYLIAPDLDPAKAIWTGPDMTDSQLLKAFDVDHENTVLLVTATTVIVHTTMGLMATITAIAVATTMTTTTEPEDSDEVTLLEAMILARINKTPIEIALSRESTRITSDAHRVTMQSIRPGMFEYQLGALFQYECDRQGGKPTYLSIVGSGVNGAYLHYTKNDRQIKDGDLVVLDAACEVDCYTSDVTRTFPANGRFSPEQLEIYNLVREMQSSVISLMEKGIEWREMFVLSQKIGIRGLKRLGIFTGDENDLFESNIIRVFYPHGLGHLLGLNVHDDGLGLAVQRPEALMGSATLPPGMLLTVEPGIYFNPAQVESALQNPDLAQYLDEPTLRRYMSVGGVRIEDVVLMLPNGTVSNITTITSDPHEIEQIVQEGQRLHRESQQMGQDVGSGKEKYSKEKQQTTTTPAASDKNASKLPQGAKKRLGVFKKLMRAIRGLF